MAAIPSSGSLVATHDYYRSEHLSWQIYSAILYVTFFINIAVTVIILHFTLLFLLTGRCKCKCFRAHRIHFQQQFLWQFGLYWGSYSTPPKYKQKHSFFFMIFYSIPKSFQLHKDLLHKQWAVNPDLHLFIIGLPRQDSGHWWASFFFGKQSTLNGHDTQPKWV